MASTRSPKDRSRTKRSSSKRRGKSKDGVARGKCIHCQTETSKQCAACFTAICKSCSMRHEGERYCSQICMEADGRTHQIVESANATDAAQELRMFIADPWDRQLYRKIFVWGSLVALVFGLWYFVYLTGEAQPKRDIRDIAQEHGVNIEGVKVGTANLNRSKDTHDPDVIELPKHLQPAPPTEDQP